MLSAAGPTGGKLLRPSNGELPRRIGWIQCVGSRTTKGQREPLLFLHLLHDLHEGGHLGPGAL